MRLPKEMKPKFRYKDSAGCTWTVTTRKVVTKWFTMNHKFWNRQKPQKLKLGFPGICSVCHNYIVRKTYRQPYYLIHSKSSTYRYTWMRKPNEELRYQTFTPDFLSTTGKKVNLFSSNHDYANRNRWHICCSPECLTFLYMEMM